MKHNWEYKQFTDIATSITPRIKVDKSDYLLEGPVPIISQEESYISGYWDNLEDITPHNGPIVIFGDHSRVLKYVDCDFVVGADGVKIISPKDCICAKFLYYFLKWYNIPSLGYSRHFKLIKEATFPVPSIKTQERIVAELDKINEVIEDCRELVRNLDDLAQSLFYNFFGDPVTNPKGWVVKKFSEVFKLSSGDGLSAKQIEPGPFPVYGGNGIVGYHATSNLGGNNIIIGRVGALCGNVRLVKGDIFVTDNAFITTFKEILNDKFAEYLLTLLDLRQYAKAAAQPVISNSSLKNIQIPLPPLQLQQEFAKRIELIEFQKKAVEETIANLKTLLDSRMDYWFN